MELAFHGYGLRWKIEEVHRQIKMDYHWEQMRLLRYQALKNMKALLWMAVSFLYTRLEKLTEEIINHPRFGLKNRKRLKGLMRFKFYKLAPAIKFIKALSRLYDQINFSKDDLQMSLPFSPTRLAASQG